MKRWQFGRKASSDAVTQKEQIDLQSPRNAYYDTVSNIYHSLFLIFLAALLVFACVSVLCNLELFTYENFYYLAKDIGAASDLLSGTGNIINYETSVRNQSFTLYRGGLAVGGDSGLQLFTATGRETLNTSHDYVQPVLHGSQRYLLVYDIGEKRYSVYNSFVCVHHEETDYPIFAGATSDSGYYAVVSESYEHKGVVSLYNDRFELVNRYNRTEMVTCTAINQSGTRVAFATAQMHNGAYTSTLVIAVPGSAETNVEMQFDGLFAYSVSFIDQHRLLIVGDTAAYIVSVDDGTNICSIPYAGMQLAYANCDQSYTALLFSINPVTDSQRLIIVDKNGKLFADFSFEAGISQLCVQNDYVFLLTESGIARIEPQSSEYDFIKCTTQGKTLLIRDGDEVLLCGGQSAVYYRFESR